MGLVGRGREDDDEDEDGEEDEEEEMVLGDAVMRAEAALRAAAASAASTFNRCVVADPSCNCEAWSPNAPGVVTPDTAPDIFGPA